MDKGAGKILVVDDDPTVRAWIDAELDAAGMECVAAADGEEGLRLFDDTFSAVLMDINLPGKDGIACVTEMKRRVPGIPCIMISAGDDVRRAVNAMKAGAFEYLRKPLDPDELMLLLKQALHTGELDKENCYLRTALGSSDPVQSWRGGSRQSREVLEKMKKIADSDATVLITGETGTGKSLIARLIHNAGKRVSQPFITVSCGTLPHELVEAELFGHEKGAFTGATKERPGRLEIAGNGAVYLDEIGDLPLSLQPKVLRMLQEREFERVGGNETHHMDARIIASTNRRLSEMCDAGEFRRDLFFRLSVLPIDLPPLRERQEDIEPIASAFVAHLSEKQAISRTLSPDALEALMVYDWPGNVRELQNVLERASAFADGDTITRDDLTFLPSQESRSQQVTATSLAGRSLADIEKAAIEQTLASCNGNKARTARTLGISEKSVYNKMKRLGI